MENKCELIHNVLTPANLPVNTAVQRSDRISCLVHISLVLSFRLILKGYYRTAEFAKKMAMRNLTCHRHSHKKSKSLLFLKIDTYFFYMNFYE